MARLVFASFDSASWFGVNPYGTPFRSLDSRLDPDKYSDGCGGYYYEDDEEYEEDYEDEWLEGEE